MSDAQRQRMQGTNGASRDDAATSGGVPAQRSEQSLGIEDVKFDAEEQRATIPLKDSDLATSGPITVHVVGRSDVGLVREHNEDNYLLADLATGSRDPSTFHEVPSAGLLLAVCDGMGGAAAGEVASQMAVDTIYEMMRRSVPAPDRDALARALMRAIEEAGARIFEGARADRSRRGMGTTSTVATLMDKTLFVGQVGDSRAYVLRNGELKQVTKDQSLVNQLIEAGQLTEDEAEAFEHSNIILQALGTTEQVSVDLTFLELRRGDRLLMCSDGLSGLVHGDVIREVMAEYQDLNACCERLIELAKAGGGHDNVTVLLCDFNGEGLAAPQPTDLAGYQQYPLPLEPDARPAGSNSDTPTLAPPTGKGEEGQGYDAFADFKPERETASGSGLRYVLLAVVLLAIAGAVYYWTGAASQAPAHSEEQVAPVAAPVTPEPPARVDVVVRTDVENAELVIDGESFGTASDGRWVLDLAPGPHKLEARAAGSTVSSTTVSLREAVPATVLLTMPEEATGAEAGAATAQAEGQPATKPSAEPAKPEGDDSAHRHHRRRERTGDSAQAAGENPAAATPAAPTPTPAPVPAPTATP